jgi:hypothetical protein
MRKILLLTTLALITLLTQSATPEQRQEAKRYFSEFQRLHREADYAGARKKLNAAIALDAKNYGYYKTLLKLNKQLPKIRYVFNLGNSNVMFLGDYRYFIISRKTDK